ncbi:MAG: efflux RND transporter periplasmic adaptor subunit [Smithellaceae bacterium]|nr:efflux RND transporter periplasmic adaptor subunit [Smithellaceae bacterium]
MKTKQIIAVIIILILILGGGIYLCKRDGKEQKFTTEKVVLGDISSQVTATGTVNAVTTVLVGTQVSGTISKIYVDYNSPVRKGQLLAQIDPASFQAQVDQARANLVLAKANVNKAKATAADAKRIYERNKQLIGKNLIAQGDLDTSQATYDSDQAQVDAARAQVDQAQAALSLAETNLRNTRIVSPVNGMVISRNIDIGQTVAASFQTPTLFSIAEDLTRMQIDTSVDEADIGKVQVNQSVEFTVDAYPEQTFRGKVSVIRNAPITVQNVVTYDVIINVDNPELKLKPGMTANVSIITATRRGVLKIPNAALRFKMPGQEKTRKGPSIWVLENGQPREIRVSPGISDGSSTEIASGEIRAGMDVVIDATGTDNGQAQRPHGPGFL